MNTLTFLPLFLGGLKGWQLIVILILILLLFGAGRIPQMMKNLGKGVHSFKQGMEEAKREMNKPLDSPDNKPVDKDKDSK